MHNRTSISREGVAQKGEKARREGLTRKCESTYTSKKQRNKLTLKTQSVPEEASKLTVYLHMESLIESNDKKLKLRVQGLFEWPR